MQACLDGESKSYQVQADRLLDLVTKGLTMRITYRNCLIATHDGDGRYVAVDPSEPNAFKMFSADLRRVYNAIDGLWSPLVGATDRDEFDLDAVVRAR